MLLVLGFALLVIPASVPKIGVFNPEVGGRILWVLACENSHTGNKCGHLRL